MCTSDLECNDRGYCSKNQCRCDVAWFGASCDENLDDYLPRAFNVYQTCFIVFYAVVGAAALVKFYFTIKKERQLTSSRGFFFMIHILRSPINLIMMSILLICAMRILWTCIDPFGFKRVLHRSIERLLFETTFSFLFLIYEIVLYVWYSIYAEMSRKNKKLGKFRFPWFKFKIFLFVVFIFASQITISILKGFQGGKIGSATLFVYASLFLFLIILIIEFMVYGWLLYRCVIDQEAKVNLYFQKVAGGMAHTGQIAAIVQPEKTQNGGINAKGEYSEENSNLQTETARFSPGVKIFQHKRSKGHRYLSSPALSRVHKGYQLTPRFDPSKSRSQAFNTVGEDLEGSLQSIGSLKERNYIDNLERLPSVVSPTRLNSNYGRLGLGKTMSRLTEKENEEKLKQKIRQIVEKHQVYLQPVEIIDDKDVNLAADVSIILDEDEEVQWDYFDEEDQIKQDFEQKNKEERMLESRKLVEEIKSMRIVRQLTENKGRRRSIFSDQVYNKLFEDPAYLRNHQETTRNDKIIMKKIFTLTVIAIVLEFIFAFISVLVFASTILQNPAGMITSMWISGVLEICAVVAIIFLLSIVQTQEKENLRMIMAIGRTNNRVNKLYGFVLPKYLRKDESKKRLERSINQNTISHPKIRTLPIESKD